MVSTDRPSADPREPGVRCYELARPLLACIDLTGIIDEAIARARVLRGEQALDRFKFELRYLLPTEGRTHGERWEPAAVVPRGYEGRAVRDNWIRLAGYLGAIDGWSGAVARAPRGPVPSDFAIFYSAAYARVQIKLSESLVGVHRG